MYIHRHGHRGTDNQQTILPQSTPVVDPPSRFSTLTRTSTDRTTNDGTDHSDSELSTSMAYGAVSVADRQRLGSDMSTISEDVECTYRNPIYVNASSRNVD